VFFSDALILHTVILRHILYKFAFCPAVLVNEYRNIRNVYTQIYAHYTVFG